MVSLPLLLAASALLPPHPNSWSQSHVRVDGARLELRTTIQHLSILEILPALDLDANGILSEDELAAGRADLEGYVLSHYTFWTGTSVERGSGTRLEGRLTGVENGLSPDVFEPDVVHFTFAFEAAAPLEDLRVEMILFVEVPDDHLDACTIDWNGLDEIPLTFSMGFPSWRLAAEHAPKRRGTLPWFARGLRAAPTTWVALGLLLALCLAARSRAGVLGVSACAAVAVPPGVALGALGTIPLEPRFVELVATLSVAYVAATTLLTKEARRLWPEALLFGVVVGCAAGGVYAETIEFEEVDWEASRTRVLVARGVGLGLGVAVLPLLLAPAAGHLARRPVRLVGSALLVLVGLVAFAQRAGWLPG